MIVVPGAEPLERRRWSRRKVLRATSRPSRAARCPSRSEDREGDELQGDLRPPITFTSVHFLTARASACDRDQGWRYPDLERENRSAVAKPSVNSMGSSTTQSSALTAAGSEQPLHRRTSGGRTKGAIHTYLHEKELPVARFEGDQRIADVCPRRQLGPGVVLVTIAERWTSSFALASARLAIIWSHLHDRRARALGPPASLFGKCPFKTAAELRADRHSAAGDRGDHAPPGGERYQTLLGATGTGKTATMAWIDREAAAARRS